MDEVGRIIGCLRLRTGCEEDVECWGLGLVL